MGLDMHLTGEKFFWKGNRKEDGFEVEQVVIRLGYWRKHPNLHGFIVNTFAGGKDECQRIELDAAALSTIIAAVKADELPHTEGFFFGQSYKTEEQITEDVAILEKALGWMLAGDLEPILEPQKLGALTVTMIKPDDFIETKETRTVVYRASW